MNKRISFKAKLSLFLYSVAGYLLLPFVVLYLARRMLKSEDYRRGFWQRLGYISKSYTGCIHIHCASLGEVNAVKTLINQLIKSYPQKTIVVSNSTPTGALQVKNLFGDKVVQVMAPIDTWGASRRFSRRLNPTVSLFTEVEIWPNWIHILQKRGVSLAMVNARLSERSFNRYQKWASLFSTSIASFSWIGCQSREVADRYLALNAPSAQVTGNLKFDIQLQPDLLQRMEQLQGLLKNKRPTWIAASVHPDEYQQILTSHLSIIQDKKDCLLILVPRHPEQFTAVADYLSAQKTPFVTRSSQAQVTDQHAVWLIDSLGELLEFYALADIAFVGGSLVDRGGHNPLEPAALGKPILMGPYQINCLETCHALQQHRALGTIENAEQLTHALMRLWQEPNLYQAAAVGANLVVMENQGATLKTMTALKALLKH